MTNVGNEGTLRLRAQRGLGGRGIGRFILGLAAALLLIGSVGIGGASASTTKKTDDQSVGVVAVVGSAYMVQVMAAQADGIFHKHGIKLNLINVSTSGTTVTAALTTGQADFAFTGPSVVAQADQNGIPLGYACGSRSLIDNTILVPKNSTVPITPKGGDPTATLRALKGKRLGVAGIGSFNQLTFMAALQTAGISPSDVTWVVVGGIATASAALASGQVDAVLGYGGLTELAESQGDKVAVPVNRLKGFGGQYYNGWVVDTNHASQNAERINAFCAAMVDVYKFFKTARGQAYGAKVLVKHLGFSQTVAQAFMKHTAPYFYPYLSAARLSYTLSFLKSIGQASQSNTSSLVWANSKYLSK